MKQKLLKTMRMLLVAVLLGVGASNAWATETVLSPTGGVTTVNTGSSESAYNALATTWNINQGGITGGNIGRYAGPYCLVKFDASSISGTITEASLSFDYASSAYNTSYNVYLLGAADWNATTVVWSTLSADAKSATTIGSDTWSVKNTTGTISYTITGNVTKSLMGMAICCNTGREQTISNIKLTINHTTATVYTATFTETNSLNPTVTIYTDAGRTETINNGALIDGTQYYYRATLHGYQSYEGSFTVNGANPSINFAMTAAEEVESLKVYARISGNNYLIKTIDLDDKYVGEQVTFTYPKYYKLGTTLYQISDTHYNTHGGYYKWNNYTLDGNDLVLNYDAGTITNVVYYSEGEDVEGMTADAGSNADIRCSGGQGGRSTDELSLTTLGTGVYKLYSQVWGSKNEDGTYTFRAAGTDVLVHALTGSLDAKDALFNVVSGTAAIKVQGSTDTGGRVLDYVFIQKLQDNATVSVYNGNFENSTWNAAWSGTGADKATAFVKQTSSQTWGATGNFAEMWTNSSFTAEANLNQMLINVPAGDYILSADILNNVSSSGGVLYAKVGSASDVTKAAENGSGANESLSFTVAATSNVVVGFKTTAISTKKGWIAIDNFVLDQVISATVGAAGFATFSSPYALDFTGLGVKAYKATLTGDNTVLLSPVTKVPANTGLLLAGAADTYNIPVIASASAIDGNLLKASADEAIAASVAGTYHYVLASGTNGVGFYNLATAKNIGAGKAYLETTTALASTSARVAWQFADDDDTITGVSNLTPAIAEGDGAVYNLNGQRVNAPAKGLYIKNGKKVVIK